MVVQRLHDSFKNNFSYTLLLGVLLALPFSYYPLLTFGKIAGVHIDISLLYILILITIAGSLPFLFANRNVLKSNPAWVLLLFFTVFTSLSVLWSANSARGIITAGFMWVMLLLVSLVVAHHPALIRNRKMVAILFGSSIAVSLAWATWQLIGDSLGISNTFTLLPQNYNGNVFGVARPTGFALEPQFFANILLAPLGWFVWRALKNDSSGLSVAGAPIIFIFILLSLSRGAILASFVIIVVLLVASRSALIVRAKVLSLLVAGIVLAGAITYSAASLRQSDNISGYQALSGTVSHLSLEVIKLPINTNATTDTVSSSTTRESAAQSSPGYVISSTTSRLSMSEEALRIWQRDIFTTLFGVGAGGFGASLPRPAQGAVVNNYYLETLAELGIVGLGLFMGTLGTIGTLLVRNRQWLSLAILLGYTVQFIFFSGNANIVHVWVLIGVLAAIATPYQRKQNKSAK